MKLLLDQNLSFRLARPLARLFAGTRHVSAVGLADADDESIWRFAKANGFTIATKDSDFFHRSIVRGHPPKVVQLQVGNASTDQIAELLRSNRRAIGAFLRDDKNALMILDARSSHEKKA